MKVISASNVNDAWWLAVDYTTSLLADTENYRETRAGPVVEAPEPVATVYKKPTERVLFCPVRNANPFFHLMEALWMLAGRNDVKWLDQFIKNFSEMNGEADGTEHDAYGYRWRQHFGFDQVAEIIHRLKTNPADRQCVLQMWDATPEPYIGFSEADGDSVGGGANDLLGDWKTRPCNTHAYFRVTRGELHMTVCCRSNDAVWGCYGANAVHFSMLQEYMAHEIGVGVGTYTQVSNNWHVYRATHHLMDAHSAARNVLWGSYPGTMPLCDGLEPGQFDYELNLFMQVPGHYEGPSAFLQYVAAPMFRANTLRRGGVWEGALGEANSIQANDWLAAASGWLGRAYDKKRGVTNGVE